MRFDEGCLLNPGSFDAGSCSRGGSCSGRVAIGSRGSRDRPLLVVGLGSFGCELVVGRYEVGRGLGRVFCAVELVDVAVAGFGLLIGGGRFVKLPMPKLELAFRRSLEGEGRKRVFLISPPRLARRFSLDADGRTVLGLGIGNRDIGRGRPLDLPATALFSSILICLLGLSVSDVMSGGMNGLSTVGSFLDGSDRPCIREKKLRFTEA